MVALTKVGHFFEEVALAIRRWKRLERIPTDKFKEILSALVEDGWKKQHVYDGFDAWIDYGRVDLSKGTDRLRLVWSLAAEGEISGSPERIREIGKAYGLK